MNDEPMRIEPPLYLASAAICCWRCGAEMPAIALIAPEVPGSHGEVCILSDIRALPERVLAFIEGRFPTFKCTYSKTAGTQYYANTCPKCGVLSGDFYLHSEPGAPFFPTTGEEAAYLKLERIPLDGPIPVRASVGLGVGGLILESAERIDVETDSRGE